MERITILESTTTRVTRMIQTIEGVRFQVLKVEEDVPLNLSMWLEAQQAMEESGGESAPASADEMRPFVPGILSFRPGWNKTGLAFSPHTTNPASTPEGC